MDTYYSQMTQQKPQPITIPKHLLFWILSHVARPIAGFEHKRTKNGQYISLEEQLYETYYQVMLIATYLYNRGYSEEKILSILSPFNQTSQ